MKVETLKKIYQGEKLVLNIQGHRYQIALVPDSVELIPLSTGSIATPIDRYSYAYTHGGDIFQSAVDAAHEIRNYIIERQAEESDV